MPRQRSQCKVCNSPNRNYFELVYFKAQGMVTFQKMSELAMDKGEGISRKSFSRHFNNHYDPSKVQKSLDKNVIDDNIQKVKSDSINILDEIRANLNGLKSLIGRAKNTKNLGDVVAVYREHRQTLAEIERLRDKLSSTTDLSQADLYKIVFWAASELCEDCRKDFWSKLDEKLRERGFK